MTKAGLGLLAVVAALVAGSFAAAARAAVPANTSPPTISGTPKEGSTLTANDGTWTNSPTSFTYQWQRCASDGRSCGDITGASSKTYTPASTDVGHALRVVVTAVNADGRASAVSGATDAVSGKSGPTNTVRPSVSGNAVVGGTLRVSNGSWSPTPASYGRQWQRCESDGTGCTNIAGATGQSYGVRSADTGRRLRALVTARTSSGNTTVASSLSAVVSSTGGTTTVVTTTPTTTVIGNRAPVLSYLSLRVSGGRAYARFRVCDDRTGRITIVERDSHNRALSATRRIHVTLNTSCAVYSKRWTLAHRFRTHGRYVSSARAVDAQGRLGLLKSRSVFFR